MEEIRPLSVPDCDAASAIVASNPLWSTRYHWPPEKARADLAQAIARGDLVLGAFAGSLRGFAWCLPLGAFGRFPYLRLLAVAPSAQGGGVGARLLDAAEAHFAGARQMLLMVSDFNDGAQRFYARRGYARVGSCPDFLIDGVAEELWMKRLEQN
jgi:ribosomal protein S18 acetylase RimI-like enzyme